MTVSHVTLVHEDDWEALYINGRLSEDVEQNHRLDYATVLESLVGTYIASFSTLEVTSHEGEAAWLGAKGFPENLNDIPQEDRI